MKMLDLTHCITPEMPVYPGTEPPRLTAACTMEKDGFRETLLQMYSHTGTHMDAPSHFVPGGRKGVGEDSISLDPCDTEYYPNHMILLGAGLVNTENLTGLEALVGKTFTFLTLPLKWEHADGSSCRAMAMLREEETR